jgi:hypothetical protein
MDDNRDKKIDPDAKDAVTRRQELECAERKRREEEELNAAAAAACMMMCCL